MVGAAVVGADEEVELAVVLPASFAGSPPAAAATSPMTTRRMIAVHTLWAVAQATSLLRCWVGGAGGGGRELLRAPFPLVSWQASLLRLTTLSNTFGRQP